MNLEEEVRNGYLISSKMKKVWAIQLTLLVKLLEVCKKYNLRVWVEGGSLLGTIREQGYIPWDDDIDLIMFREDYNKLLQVAKEEFKSPYFFQNAYNDRKYYYGHAQLRMDGTTAILPGNVNHYFHLGIFIDIFILDQMPKDKTLLVKSIIRGEKLRKILILSSFNLSFYKPKLMLGVLLSHLYTLIFGYLNTYRKLEKNYSEFNGQLADEYSLPIVYPAVSYLIRRKKEWYSNTIYMPFEDIEVPVPSGYDYILRQQYGDYMKPVKAPSLHGNFLILDTEKDYTEYLAMLRKDRIKSKLVGLLRKKSKKHK